MFDHVNSLNCCKQHCKTPMEAEFPCIGERDERSTTKDKRNQVLLPRHTSTDTVSLRRHRVVGENLKCMTLYLMFDTMIAYQR